MSTASGLILLMREGERRQRAITQHLQECFERDLYPLLFARLWWFNECYEVQQRAHFLLTWNGK